MQHQFEDVLWERRENWDYAEAALRGSSFYKLPKVLQWFSGSIGIHHVHHLNPRIPNYALQDCLDAVPALQKVRPFTLWQGIKSAWLVLWDEDQGRLVGFADARRAQARHAQACVVPAAT